MKTMFTVSGEKYDALDLSADDWKLTILRNKYLAQEIKITSKSLNKTIYPKVKLRDFTRHHFVGLMEDRLIVDDYGNLSINNQTVLTFTGKTFISSEDFYSKIEEENLNKLSYFGISDLVEGEHYLTIKGRRFQYVGRKTIDCREFFNDGYLYKKKQYEEAHYLREVFHHGRYSDTYIKFSKSLGLKEHIPKRELGDVFYSSISSYHKIFSRDEKNIKLKLSEFKTLKFRGVIGSYRIILYNGDYLVNVSDDVYMDGEFKMVYQKIEFIEDVLLDIVTLGDKFNIRNYLDDDFSEIFLSRTFIGHSSTAIGIEII